MKRKNIICVASSIFIIILLVCVIIKLTCIVNLDDGSSTSISDAEYLEVSDLYIFIDDDEKNLLEELAKNMILDSYYNNGFNDQYTTIVSNDIFKRLNPNNTGNKFDFELISVDVQCLCSEDKAIVFFTKDCSMQSSSNRIECKIVTDGSILDRLYFEKINDEWKVVSFLQSA